MSYHGAVRKAEIVVSETAHGMKAALLRTLIGGSGTCFFNPSEFTISREVSYVEHRIPGLGRPISQFISGGAEIMQFSLLFDTYAAGIETHNLLQTAGALLPDLLKIDVRFFTKPITKLMEISDELHAPPIVSFRWGSIHFEGFMISCAEKFTMFNSIGTPVRSVLEISLRSNVKDSAVRNSPDRTKHRTVTQGDRLFEYAHEEYGSSTDWRHIANANGIDNPRLLRSGTNIVIPPI